MGIPGNADDVPLSTDQRGTGYPRIVGNVVDIGAFESSFVNPTSSDLTMTVTTPVDGSFVNAPAKIRGNVVIKAGVSDRINSVVLTIKDTTNNTFFNGTSFTSTPATIPATGTGTNGAIGTDNTFATNSGPGTAQVLDGHTYAITATATDSVGNSKSSNTVTVTVDKTRPSVTSDAPANSAVIKSLSGPLSGSAMDPLGPNIAPNNTASGLQSVRYSLTRQRDKTYWDGNSFQSAFAQVVDDSARDAVGVGNVPHTYSLAVPTNLADGIYVLVISSYDNVGNNSGGGSLTRSFTVDTTAPSSIIITQAGDKMSPVDGDAVTTLTPIKGTATDTGSGIARVELQVVRESDGTYFDGTSFKSATPVLLPTGLSTPSSGTTPWARSGGLPTTSADAGTYTVTVIATDRAGLQTRKSLRVTKTAMRTKARRAPAPAAPASPSGGTS